MIEKAANYREAQLQPLEDVEQEDMIRLVETLVNIGKVSPHEVNLVLAQVCETRETALATVDDEFNELEALKSDPVRFKKAYLADLTDKLEPRFKEHMERHTIVEWDEVYKILKGVPANELICLGHMESSGGEPDLLWLCEGGGVTYFDFFKESPVSRSNLTYPAARQKIRKMGVFMVGEKSYNRALNVNVMDEHTQSWLQSPFLYTIFGKAKVGCGKDWAIENCSKFDANPHRGFRTIVSLIPG